MVNKWNRPLLSLWYSTLPYLLSEPKCFIIKIISCILVAVRMRERTLLSSNFIVKSVTINKLCIMGYSILKWYIASLLDIPILFQECPHNDIHYCCIASFLTKISILAFNTSYEQLAMFSTPRSGPTPRRRLLCPGWLGGSSSITLARRSVEFRSPVRSTICFMKMRRASCTECFSSNCWTLDPNSGPDQTWNLSQKS